MNAGMVLISALRRTHAVVSTLEQVIDDGRAAQGKVPAFMRSSQLERGESCLDCVR